MRHLSFLDEDEYKEFETQINKLMEKYEQKKSDKTKKYSVLVGLIRKEY